MYAAYPGSATSELSPPSRIARSTSTLQPNGILTVGSMGSICAELNRQLDAWYNSLPDGIKPDLSQDDPQNLQEGWIRSRYWSAKHIICRPCLVYAASVSDPLHLPSYVLKYSEMCVESCRKYIKTASYILMRRTQYTWMTIQALVKYLRLNKSAVGLPQFANDQCIGLSRVLSLSQLPLRARCSATWSQISTSCLESSPTSTHGRHQDQAQNRSAG